MEYVLRVDTLPDWESPMGPRGPRGRNFNKETMQLGESTMEYQEDGVMSNQVEEEMYMTTK